mmetsp:Transcript_33551/g.76704  ORF Transcript_33551/g.76704 Transcript_33551/m.76704 type:complete len:99 (-) Transcript_33551:121-417(-)
MSAEMSQNVEEGQALKRSARAFDELETSGLAMLAQLAGQRDRLKSAQRKLLDVMNTLGVSNSLMRFIEKRHFMDSLIVYGGMLITVAILALVYWYWRM